MINAVMVGLIGHASSKRIMGPFRESCWALDVEPEFVDAIDGDSRADGVEVVPTFRVFADDDPYGDVLAEHRGAATEEQIRALLERGLALV